MTNHDSPDAGRRIGALATASGLSVRTLGTTTRSASSHRRAAAKPNIASTASVTWSGCTESGYRTAGIMDIDEHERSRLVHRCEPGAHVRVPITTDTGRAFASRVDD